ncbi:MAG: hypothetical protein JZU52_12680 [Lamprocystis purpurea]|jgi:hypothetical protein|uniref:hypothetical protein n=1 Tax=Lamprocystis purpurea TaxID=61598 RepID=UPI000366DFB4|nr:hypothetical protein [Lamprocystis purpurea]MBV5274451.1 hypothetical protein [Lamprocystis purpurea]
MSGGFKVEVSPALAALLGQPQALVQRAGRLAVLRAAESYADDIHDWVRAGRAYTDRTGHLTQETDWHPTGDGALIYSNKEYARYVEFGTAAHVIAPKPGRQALRFFTGGPGGGQVIRRAVTHPGTKPRPFFFADAAAREARMLDEGRKAVAEVVLGASSEK